MRISICLALMLILAEGVQADTLRVGNQVLTTGDSAARVVQLMGKPDHKARDSTQPQRKATGKHGKKPRAGKVAGARVAGGPAGERWQYRRGHRTVTVVLVDGRVARIE